MSLSEPAAASAFPNGRRGPASRLAAILLALLATLPAYAAAAGESEPILTEQAEAAAIPDGGPWWDREGATGEWLGRRAALRDAGVEIFGGYAAEGWGNTTGGLRRGAVYTGLIDWGVNVDFERLAGWQGATASTTWLWVSGSNASEELVGNLFTVSNIAALSCVQMLEAWLEQNLFDDALSVRLGQLTADSEFAVTETGRLFINSSFGWPGHLAQDLPAANPSYPMGALGARIAVHPAEWLGFQSAAYYGDPCFQDFDRGGFRWGIDDIGWLWISEAQLDWRGGNAGVRPGHAALGFWLHTAHGAPGDASAGDGYTGANGIYVVLDQRLFSEGARGDEPAPGVSAGDDAQGLSWFARVGYSPSGGAVLRAYVDTGFAYRGLLPGRDDDVAGIGVVWGGLTSGAQQAIDDEGFPSTGAELVIEATYRWQITPWLSLQPDVQVVIDPGARSDLGTAVVTGLRTAIRF